VTTAAAIGYWALFSAAYHLGWEVLQLPLYTIWRSDIPTIVFAVAHCTAGDVLVAVSTYVIGAAVARTWQWPMRKSRLGIASAVAAGVAYTAFSEWLNVSVRGSWAYAETMPLIAGIGLSPLLQWALVPLIVLRSFRFAANRIDHPDGDLHA
jgi:hypothetical protein